MDAGVRTFYTVLGLVGIIVPIGLTVWAALRVRGRGRGLAIVGLVLVTVSQLIQVALNPLLDALDVGFGLVVGITSTLSSLVLTAGFVLVAVALVRLSRGPRQPPAPLAPPSAPGSYPTAPQQWNPVPQQGNPPPAPPVG